MRLSIGKAVNSLLASTGYRLSRIPSRPATRSAGPTSAPNRTTVALESVLTRITGRGLEINTIIDVGASDGLWTRLAHPFFPQAKSFMVEANPVHEPSLQKFKRESGYADYVLAAGGDTVGEIYFDARDSLGGLASHEPLSVPSITVPVTTIDTLVQQHSLRPPFLIKLDTHGFEVPILEGARRALLETNLLCVETYAFKLNATSLKFYQLCQYLADLGFAPIDFCDPIWRAQDNAWWQFDLLFVRADRKEFEPNANA